MSGTKCKKVTLIIPLLILAIFAALFSYSQIEVNAAVATPKVTSVSNVTTGVKLTWGKVTGAAKYRVFVKSGSSWVKLGDTTSATYTHTAAKSGTTYTYTVRCISSNGKSYTSSYNKSGWSIKYIAAPKVTKTENTTSGVKLTWGKVTGAAKYRVFLKSGSSWVKLGDTTSTAYTHTAAKSGTTYTYTVRCISSNAKSYTSAYNSSGWSIKYVAAPQVTKIENSLSGVKLTWDSVAGAEKYRVFAKSGSSWTKLADVPSPMFTHFKALSDTTYTYTVRCISSDGKAYTSAYNTSGWSIHYIAAPHLTWLYNTSYGIKLNWSKVVGAEKYRVFVKSGSSWVKLADTDLATFTHTAAKSGTTYTYTVRCISSDGKSYTSAYSTNGWSVKCVRDDVLPSRTVTVDLSTGTANSYNNMTLLNNALAQATDSEQLIVKVKTAGTYYIASNGSALKLRSNTTLDLNGSTLIRSGSMYNLFQNCDFNGDTDGTGYTLTKNIGIKNGTLDGLGGSPEQANLVNFGHATGITIEDVNFKNCRGGHLIELTGCKDGLISNCTFTGFIGSAGIEDNEAIQLDICNNDVAGSWNGVYYSDSTVCSNITVDGCTFYDYPSGVGNHHTITGIHSNNIYITNNKFLNTMNTSQPAIWCYDFIDSVVSGNTVSGNYSCGIKVSAGSVDVIDNTVKGVAYDAVYITKSNSYVQGKNNATAEEYAYNCSVKNNTLSTSGDHVALSIFSGSGVVEVSGNNISATGESALVISGADTSVSSVKSNTFKSTSAYGILVASNAKVTSITANTITGKLHGIQVSSNANVSTISNNSSITATSGSGVYVSGATATTISGNTIKNCGESGICVSSTGVTSTVQSNSISGCGDYGIRINNSSLMVNVSKNTFSKNSSGSMYIKAKGTIQSA